MSDIKPTKTITYKTVGKLDIPLDLYLPESARKAPILLWFHGGGLLQGRRDSLAAHMRRGVQKYGYACISADYRLAPQVSVADIRDDVKDCIKFIRDKLSSHVDKDVLDTSRLAVSGSSAGGYLSLLAGLYAEPKPNVILPIYGTLALTSPSRTCHDERLTRPPSAVAITDPLGTFFTNPQPAPMGRHSPAREEVEPYLDPKANAVANCGPSPDDPRGHMYVYMMAVANLAELYHVPKASAAEPFRIARNVFQHRLPPAYFLHGDSDTCVGVEQSDEVVGAMLGCGIDVQYERPHGKDHFLDTGADYENYSFYSFMMKHLHWGGKVAERTGR